jgi:hypothetical protein
VNALDEYGRSRARDYARESRTLETFGCSCEELDLRDYFAAPEERLDSLDLIDDSTAETRTGLVRGAAGYERTASSRSANSSKPSACCR